MNINLDLIKPGSTVGVAVSGGSDSMALLHYLFFNRARLGISVAAVNVDHGLRGAESENDSAFVKDYCEKNGIPVYGFKVNPQIYGERGGSTENKARKMRYAFFHDCVSAKKADVIATAHHESDNAETVLLHILRGAGLKGARGIPEASGAFIRPLLNTPKREIDAYISEHGVPFVTDSTNAEERYLRNFIRKTLADIKTRLPRAEQRLTSFAAAAAADDDFINKFVPEFFGENGAVKIPESIARAERAVKNRVVFRAFAAIGVENDIEKKTAELVGGLFEGRTGARLQLPCGVTAYRDYDGITLTLNHAEPPCLEEKPFAVGVTEIGGGFIDVGEVAADGFFGGAARPGLAPGEDALYFDADKIPEGAVIRTRREGDVFTKFGGGTVKLKKYLIDNKICARERDGILLVAYLGTVYVIGGRAISGLIKTDGGTKRVFTVRTAVAAKEDFCDGQGF
ncbi:MAG: tRNA lysidine(34) synthetase TilS [Clostridiales bacterium]|jgi:tRNA(Ile)-lysidine synthase|nr:tRNA lysidine(34) synthetase TilS [Clostridiales bacterium]